MIGPSDVLTFRSTKTQSIKDVTVYVEPAQDLNGYDNPWPAGGGKNLINQLTAITGTYTNDYYKECNANRGQISAVHLSAGVTYTLSFDVVSSVEPFAISVGVGTGNYARDIKAGTGDVRSLYSGRVSATFTPTSEQLANGDIIAFRAPRYDTATAFTFTVSNIQLEVGSTATAWSPYSNICPISGWTGANIHVSPTTDAEDGTTYSITFPSSAGTVYGGTLDVTQGKLTVDKGMTVIRGNLSGWSKGGYGHANYIYLPDIATGVATAATGAARSAMCKTNLFKPLAKSWNKGFATDNEVAFSVSTDDYFAFNTGADIPVVNDWLNENPITFVYPLATPIEVDLTPTEVSALLGTNNIWSDCGKVSAKILIM